MRDPVIVKTTYALATLLPFILSFTSRGLASLEGETLRYTVPKRHQSLVTAKRSVWRASRGVLLRFIPSPRPFHGTPFDNFFATSLKRSRNQTYHTKKHMELCARIDRDEAAHRLPSPSVRESTGHRTEPPKARNKPTRTWKTETG